MSLFYMLGTTASAAFYDLITTSAVERSKNSEASKPQRDFSLNSRVFAFVTLGDFVDNAEMPKSIEARWYSCDRLVSKRDLTLNDAFKKSAKPDEDGRHHAWFWIEAKPLGSGQHKVEIYSNGKMVAFTNFNVRNESGEPAACQNREQTIVLADDASGKNVLFKFNRSQESDLYGAGLMKLDEIAQSLKKTYKSIDKMLVIGHTDNLGNNAYNLKLSQERAITIKNALLNRGVMAREVNTLGKGESEPVNQCASSLSQAQLIECLAPNRRVEIKIQGVR